MTHDLNFQRKQNGFTLLEFLIYISILALVTLSVGATFLTVNAGRGKGEARAEVNSNLRFAAEKIGQDIHAASAVTTPAAGIPSATLVLTHPADGTVTYCVVSGRLYRAKLGAACNASADAIIATAVAIDTPTFTRLENTNSVLSKTTVSVQVLLSASYNSTSPDWQYSQTKRTTVAVGSY